MSEWRTVFRQLIALAYLDVDAESYGALRLTDKCRPLLRGEFTLYLRKPAAEETQVRNKKDKSPVRPQDEALWEALRTLRSTIAGEAGVPPYIIFHDASLMEMIRQRPSNPEQMKGISGVGAQKLERWGPAFLEEIALHPLPELLNNRLSATVNETLILYQKDFSIEEIAKQREAKTSTIYTHLADAIEAGLLDVLDVLGFDKDEYQTIVLTIESLEDEEKGRLKPIYEALDEEYDYGILKCVQASL